MVEVDGIFVLRGTKRTLHRLCVVVSYKRAVFVDNCIGKGANRETDCEVAGVHSADTLSVCSYYYYYY